MRIDARQGTPAFLMFAALCAAPGPAWPQGLAPLELGDEPYVFETAEQPIRVDVVARGLPHPFSVAFLPNGDALIAERSAHLRIVHGATGADARLAPEPIEGAPAPSDTRLGGLHDLALHPEFATNRLVYYTYNRVGAPLATGAPGGSRAMTLVVARARFEGDRLSAAEDIFIGGEHTGGSGSRLAFGPEGKLFVTTGAPFGDAAQALGNVYGKVLRLNDDGSLPADNPFTARSDAHPAVYSFGHRDQLGLTVHAASGAVLAVEHGPNGGDEVNLIRPGVNYGWPTFSFGRDYAGPRISSVPVGDGIEQPLILWVPSVAPTGMTFYTGDRFPAWQGNLFVGSARRGQIPGTGGLERVVLNDALEELRRESLLAPLRQRVRDVRQGPDGLLYVLTDEDDGALLRISPAD